MEVLKKILEYVDMVFILYLIGYTVIMAFSALIGSISIHSKRKKVELKNIIQEEGNIKISILIPAFNEEVTILDSIESLVNLDYKNYEIIVIDDGSKDKTSEIVKNAFKMRKIKKVIVNSIKTKKVKEVYEGMHNGVPITLVKKINGGKADSLNVGINYSNYNWFLGIDADSILQQDSLKKIIEPIIHDENVIALGGSIMLNNGVEFENGKVKKYDMPKKLLPAMQVVEYNRTFLASRIMFDKLNANLIISGAFGMFRKDIVIAAGGYNSKTRGEDMELVTKLHIFAKANKIKYKMKYVWDAICWTQAPEKLKDLVKQRKRWHIGLYECMRDYRKILFKPEYGVIGSFAYLYFLLYEFLSPYIEVAGVLVTIASVLLNVFNIDFMITFFLFYTILGVLITVVAYWSTIYIADLNFKVRNTFKVLILCFFEIVALRFILSWVRFTALFGYGKNKYKWDKIERNTI